MLFFLDTANLKELQEASAYGILDGCTTNPTLLSAEVKGGKDPREHLTAICEIVKGPVSAEVIALDTEGIVREGLELAKIAPNIVVKAPLTKAGLAATKRLTDEGLRVNVTLCFTAVQALMAAKAGATYISPFVGRLDDRATSGMQVIQEIRTIYDNYDFPTQILTASVRHPIHILEAALAGSDVATLPFKVFDQLISHPLTDIGLANFLKDWEKVGQGLAGHPHPGQGKGGV